MHRVHCKYFNPLIPDTQIKFQYAWYQKVNKRLHMDFSDQDSVVPAGKGHIKLDEMLDLINEGTRLFSSTISSDVCESALETLKVIASIVYLACPVVLAPSVYTPPP